MSADEQAIISNNAVLPNAFTIPAPTLTASDILTTFNEEAISTLVADVSSVNGFTDQFEVQAKQSTATTYVSMGRSSDSRYELINVQDNVTYNIRARAVSTLGVKSPYATVDHLVIGKSCHHRMCKISQ